MTRPSRRTRWRLACGPASSANRHGGPGRRTLVVCRADAVADGAAKPFAVMQATLTAVYDRPGIAH